MLQRLLSTFTSPDRDTLQRERFIQAVTYARQNSPYYNELYRDLPETIAKVTELPVTDKKLLMARFDDWATDRAITRAEAEAFRADKSNVGKLFLSKYILTTTSGTTGFPGVFIMSPEEFRLVSNPGQPGLWRHMLALIMSGTAYRLIRGGGRHFSVATLGGHYLVSVMSKLQNPGGAENPNVKVVAADLSIPELVRELNEFQPTVFFCFAGTVAILASEQERGRLAIKPATIVMSGEGLTDDEYDRVKKTFGAWIVNQYACNEAPLLSNPCRLGWHHIISDQVIFEPVNADYTPTPLGQFSDTILLTVLYRRLQPILRYDLGDSAMQRPDACECGNPYPAFKIRGRSLDMLHAPDGRPVASLSGVFTKLRAKVRGIVQIQFVQDGEFSVRLRLKLEDDVPREDTWTAALNAVKEIFGDFGAGHYSIARDDQVPELTKGGKFPKLVREV